MTTPAHAVIQVWFIDEKTGKSFAQTKFPIAQLPESFKAETTMQLGEASYLVVSATPPTAREFGRSGELRLVLRKQEVTMMNPRDILFSLPSISNELPPMEEERGPRAQMLELHEDDWRQVEFVSLPLQDSVEVDLRAIDRIHREQREGRAFKALHVRKEVPQPLEGTWFSVGELRTALGEGTLWRGGVCLRGTSGQVAGGFAARLPSGLEVYGFEHEGRVRTLGLEWNTLGSARETDARLLAAFATPRQLLLVDWCRVEMMPASAPRLQAWFSKRT